MTAINAAGQPVSSKLYEPITDPQTGRLVYDVKMSPATILTPQPTQ